MREQKREELLSPERTQSFNLRKTLSCALDVTSSSIELGELLLRCWAPLDIVDRLHVIVFSPSLSCTIHTRYAVALLKAPPLDSLPFLCFPTVAGGGCTLDAISDCSSIGADYLRVATTVANRYHTCHSGRLYVRISFRVSGAIRARHLKKGGESKTFFMLKRKRQKFFNVFVCFSSSNSHSVLRPVGYCALGKISRGKCKYEYRASRLREAKANSFGFPIVPISSRSAPLSAPMPTKLTRWRVATGDLDPLQKLQYQDECTRACACIAFPPSVALVITSTQSLRTPLSRASEQSTGQ